MSAPALVCFIVCHGGPADHFATFSEDLARKNYQVEIYATGPALKKLEDRKIERLHPFSLEQEGAAAELAEKCSGASVIVTDVGHPFDVDLQEALAEHASKSLRLAYYDNPERYVPGGYSSTAAKVMLAAEKVLFANRNLAEGDLYEAPDQKVDLPLEKRMGLGYYPIEQAESLAKRRTADREALRAELFATYGLKDRQQKILVYVGGNNEEYFSKAFPKFLELLGAASSQTDLSDLIILFQQHPGAKGKGLDEACIESWSKEYQWRATAPPLLFSSFSSDSAQVLADAILYFQTSMGPQFALAGIPPIQVGHVVYEDLLVREGLCATATDTDSLIKAVHGDVKVESSDEAIRKGLGICPDWADRLEKALNDPF